VCPRGDCTKKPMAALGGILAARWCCVMSAPDRVVRWSAPLAVVGVATVACCRVARACERFGTGVRRVRMDRTPDPANGGRFHPCEFDGGAGFDAAASAGACASAVTAWLGHRRDAGRERRPRPWSWCPRRCYRRVACGRAGRVYELLMVIIRSSQLPAVAPDAMTMSLRPIRSVSAPCSCSRMT
jgi:hypothetical protein